MRKNILIAMVLSLLFSLVSIPSFPSVSYACSCAGPPTVEEEFQRANAVFSGEVVELIEQKDKNGLMTKKALFEVDKIWKGKSQSQKIITTGFGGGDCGYEFQPGDKYLVYAHYSSMYGDGDDLVTIICDGTKSLKSAEEDLEFLGEGEVPKDKVDLSDELSKKEFPITWIISIAIIIVGAGLFVIWNRNNIKK
jgi:hypothetical protein